MKKKIFLFLLLFVLGGALPACASSLLYAFSSGDILLKNPKNVPTYGLGRIDFYGGELVPTVIISGDTREHYVAEFTRNGKRYIYDSKVQMPNKNTTYYDIYDAAKGVDTPLAKDLILSVTPNSILEPDAEGYIYAISGTTLTRYDMLNWNNRITQTLESGYNVYSLVGLTNNANFLMYGLLSAKI